MYLLVRFIVFWCLLGRFSPRSVLECCLVLFNNYHRCLRVDVGIRGILLYSRIVCILTGLCRFRRPPGGLLGPWEGQNRDPRIEGYSWKKFHQNRSHMKQISLLGRSEVCQARSQLIWIRSQLIRCPSLGGPGDLRGTKSRHFGRFPKMLKNAPG